MGSGAICGGGGGGGGVGSCRVPPCLSNFGRSAHGRLLGQARAVTLPHNSICWVARWLSQKGVMRTQACTHFGKIVHVVCMVSRHRFIARLEVFHYMLNKPHPSHLHPLTIAFP